MSFTDETPRGLPVAGDDLVFPTGAARLTITNNFVGYTFKSITFTGSGYDLRGNALTIIPDLAY